MGSQGALTALFGGAVLLTVTLFASLLVLDDRRQKAGRGDVLCCQVVEAPAGKGADRREVVTPPCVVHQ
jgi:hypothetical protein